MTLAELVVAWTERYAPHDAARIRAATFGPEFEAFVRKHGGIYLPGWTCRRCGRFTGEEKERHDACRACGAPRLAPDPERA